MTEKKSIKELPKEHKRVIKLKNIVALLQVFFGEKDIIREIMDTSPDYLLEKYDYFLTSDTEAFKWGMHPNLKEELFNEYLELWGLKEDEHD